MVDRLRFRFLKTGKDQFTDGVKFISFLRFLKQLVENWDERNRLLTLRHYLKKWDDKAKKLKERDDALDRAMDEINKRILTNTIDTMNNACVSAKPLKSIPVARAYDVFDRLRKQYYDWVKLRELWMQLMEKYMVNAEQRLNDLLRKKIRQWRDKAKKMTEEAAKRRIAKWLEERYRIANARKNWIDLATKYDLFCNNRLLYEIRKRLAQFAKARDMVDRLNYLGENINDSIDNFNEITEDVNDAIDTIQEIGDGISDAKDELEDILTFILRFRR